MVDNVDAATNWLGEGIGSLMDKSVGFASLDMSVAVSVRCAALRLCFGAKQQWSLFVVHNKDGLFSAGLHTVHAQCCVGCHSHNGSRNQTTTLKSSCGHETVLDRFQLGLRYR
jgi:hypothetical protein